jgi:hypothetical protein
VVSEVAPLVAQVQREKVASPMTRHVYPPVVMAQRDLEFKGSHTSRSSREEQPPKNFHRRLDFRGGQ